MAAITAEKWIDDRQAKGTYTFLRSDAIAGSGLSAEAVKKALQRLARRGRVNKVKDYFYVIVPPGVPERRGATGGLVHP